MKYTKAVRVSASLADASSNLSALGLFQIVQDAVTEMMGKIKIDGVTVRAEYNAFWAFTRNRTKIFKTMPWNDNLLSVTSFISVITRATICVDVSVKDIYGDCCAYSRIEMCPLDSSTMRIRKVETVGVTQAITAENAEMDMSFSQIELPQMHAEDSVTVRSTNIDMSLHTNNVEYLRFILNTYSVKQLQDKPIREIQIRYVNQSFENDVLSVMKATVNNKDVFLIKSKDSDVIRCEVTF